MEVESKQAKKTAKTVRVNGHEVVLFDATQVPRTKGDQAGLAKGIKSNTTGAATWPKAHSRNVYVQGKPIVRHGDLFWMNGKKGNGNTLGRLIAKVSPAAVPASRANPPVMPETDKEQAFTTQLASGTINRQQLVGGIARLLPAIGSIPGGAEAVVKLGQGDYANAVARLAALSPFAHPSAANAGKENAAQQAQANAGHNTQAGNAAVTAAGSDEQTNISLNGNGGNSSDGGSATGPKRCKLETHADRKKDESKKCEKGEEAHHLVPDRAFRYGVRRDHIDKNGKIKERLQIPGGLSDRDGLTICLDKDTHSDVHKEYDGTERKICKEHAPTTGMVDLFLLEQLASEVIANYTGCNPSHLKQQLREYHGNKKMGKKFKVRADKNGRLTRKFAVEGEKNTERF